MAGVPPMAGTGMVGASTVPGRVVSLPAGQATICRHRPTQLSSKQMLGRLLPPQVKPGPQLAGQWRVPPQPSPMVPQCLPPLGASQVPAVQPEPLAQTLAMPPPPHTSPVGQAPQSLVLPQPSPMTSQYWYGAPAGLHSWGTQLADVE